MLAKVVSGGVIGVQAYPIHVEVDLSNGTQCFDIVGLPETCVRESKVRVRSALRNSGLGVPNQRTTVNLAPADVPKGGSAFDLPIAMGIVAAKEESVRARLQRSMLTAELSLDGRLRPVRGILPLAILAREQGKESIVVAPENAAEAASVGGIDVLAPATLGDSVGHFRGEAPLAPSAAYVPGSECSEDGPDMGEVRGQHVAKRGLLVAAAGGHNAFLVGVPGCGKTMLVRRLPSILPPMTNEEALECSRIYSVCGLLQGGLMTRRPLRSPHHTCSTAALVGGGVPIRPGEISLAHHGVLFLDELPEFSRVSLESLRQPLEERRIVVSRVRNRLEFPANAMVVAAANPCPCGFLGSKKRECQCSFEALRRYRARLSGPLMDRIDIHLQLEAATFDELRGAEAGLGSDEMRADVVRARARQAARHHGRPRWNAALDGDELRDVCRLDARSESLLRRCVDVHGMSARGMTRVLRVARTIADLADSERVDFNHIAEALCFRGLSVTDGS